VEVEACQVADFANTGGQETFSCTNDRIAPRPSAKAGISPWSGYLRRSKAGRRRRSSRVRAHTRSSSTAYQASSTEGTDIPSKSPKSPSWERH
jgi:hypothetical protein